MKKDLIFRAMAIFSLALVFTPNTVDAFSFGHLFNKIKGVTKKALPSIQKVAHGPIGKMALQAGEVAVATEVGPEAGALFQSTATSLHLADQEDAQADAYDAQAQQAENDGDSDLAEQHRATAQVHRKNAKNHRENHQRQKKEYENTHDRNFEDDYREHVAPHIAHHAKEMYEERFDDDDDDYGDDEDGDDDDENEDDEDDSEEEEDY